MKHFFTRLLSILFLCTNSISAMAQKAYAVMSKDSTTLTFYYDNKKASRDGTAYELNIGDNRPEWVKTEDYDIFYITDNDNFTTVVFDGSFKDARPISCAHWFSGFKNLKKIEGIENLNTSNVTNMKAMFDFCTSLTSLDVSNFNTSNVTNMYGMFKGCKSLTILDVSNFNTSNVTNMGEMFSNCESLTSLDVSKFNTSKVTNMDGMFYKCKSLTSLDVSKFNTSKVTYMSYMFRDCESLTSLDVSNFNTSNVTDMKAMFANCANLKTIYAGAGWIIGKDTDSEGMFKNSTKLVGGKGTIFSPAATDASRAKIDGGKANPGYFTAKK